MGFSTVTQMADKGAIHIQLKGKVQGVGFRPYVYRLARSYDLKGWVSNGTDGVHIHVEGQKEILEKFYQDLLRDYPPLALLTESFCREAPFLGLEGFIVKESIEEKEHSVIVLPDLDVCESCKEELYCSSNRRFRYPFITCTQCGPRYSIIYSLPYDRSKTTMNIFPMCKDCLEEYENPSDRRFYSQTNSCKECGIKVYLYGKQKEEIAQGEEAIKEGAWAIAEGQIVAVKGIGGYLLMADALNPAAILKLRERKRRASKPFALMFNDIQEVEKEVYLSEKEKSWLISRQKPILILQRKKTQSPIADLVAPAQDTLGIMLPYTPLHILLLDYLKRPLVATSANISGLPIVFEEGELFLKLGHVFDKVLTHNRDIVVPQDDSVIRVSFFFKQTIFLRRSRSFAPFLNASLRVPKGACYLALGAEKKSTVCFCHEGNVFLSQYLGDLDCFEAEENFKKTLSHFFNLWGLKPQKIILDLHPLYRSRLIGETMSEEKNIERIYFQHHKAHFWAILAEKKLLGLEEPVLGVIWDGTGYGEDGAVWGGEFFLYYKGRMERVNHFEYFPLLLGDKAVREPRISALGIFRKESKIVEDFLKPKFNPWEWKTYRALLDRKKYWACCSVGRLFDALASLLGLCDRASFEGEAAIALQRLASSSVQSLSDLGKIPHRWFDEKAPLRRPISLENLLKSIEKAIVEEIPKEEISLGFHFWLSKLIGKLAENTGARKIAFSGGVFQNSLLVDLLYLQWADRFDLFFHDEISPNDENISFGQLVGALYGKEGREIDPQISRMDSNH
ncbi:carbamoyltransferase HypF [Candidatus Methylacidiphilum infernorum]|uniref:Carbamoyltransferase n=2 Tax=Candidatus Methylacidiphilum infernorum TaxID=511746 RepID=A0ABX7PXC0_9BACT|nr:carbamoyltransferase HypF [Candidatus Methylacidiphilum infernorum]